MAGDPNRGDLTPMRLSDTTAMLRRSVPPAMLTAALTGTGILTGAGVLPAGAARSATPAPNQFSTTIDNPFLPFVPGTRMVYRSTDAGETGREVVRVTFRTRLVAGVRVRIVRDRAYVGGQLVEDTRDWYAQDRRGNVWYFGENTKTLENGKVTSTEGTWMAGRNGARAGIVMEAHPKVGDSYAQEFSPGVAEDRATVLSLDASATVPYGTFTGLLKTKDYSLLDTAVVERKFYLRGVGSVLEKEVRGGNERLALVRVTHS
jgi:hypothetical protein